MNMEFQKGPIPVSAQYKANVAEVLSMNRVTGSGFFYNSGMFDLVKLGGKPDQDPTQRMWALNLLKFNSGADGIRATRQGFLQVYPGRMLSREERYAVPAVQTIDPGNIRFVNDFESFQTKVTESGWLITSGHVSHYQFDEEIDMETLTLEQLEVIMANAENGKKPPFFDDQKYIKVEPGHVGKLVVVAKFSGVDDTVVIDLKGKQLIGKIEKDMLYRKRWEPKALVS